MDELQRAQNALGKAVDRARGGEDRALADKVRDSGERLVRQLFGLLRMTRTHDLENEAFQKPLGDFRQSLGELIGLLGAVNVATVEGQVYINDIRIRFDARTDTAAMLGKELAKHRAGGLTFHQVPGKAAMRALVEGFAAEPDPQRPLRTLQEAIDKAGGGAMELQGVFRFRVSGEETVDRQVDARALSARAADFVDAAVDSLGADRMPNPLPMRRVVSDIVDAGFENPDLWDERPDASPFGNHTLRISLVCMLIAEQLGLTGEAIQDLGVVALFHDAGYARREGAVAPTAKDPGHPGYAPPFERHGTAGAAVLLRQRGFHSAKIVRALAVLDHHADFDRPEGPPHLFARILRVAEDYDVLTARARGPALTPVEALRHMHAAAGKAYDPLLIQALINALGAYPPGTMLQLEDGRIVESIGLCRSPETWDRPLCRVRWSAELGEPDEEVRIDLAEAAEARTRVRWSLGSRGKPMLR